MCQLEINDEVLVRRTWTFIGVVLDERLTWSEHIKYTHSKLSGSLYALKLWCFRPLLCTLFRLNWAKQTPGIMRGN